MVYSKFGKEFGFEKELIHVTKEDPTVAIQEGIKCNSNYVRNNLLESSPEGYRYIQINKNSQNKNRQNTAVQYNEQTPGSGTEYY